MERWEAYLAGHEDEQFGALFDFLRIASISALPEHAADLAHAADWVAEHLRFIGVPEVRLLPTARHPVVFGRWHVGADKPTAMLYGHYDVQPPDPLDLWTSPPFEPTVRDGYTLRPRRDRRQRQHLRAALRDRGVGAQQWQAAHQPDLLHRRRRGDRQPEPSGVRPCRAEKAGLRLRHRGRHRHVWPR